MLLLNRLRTRLSIPLGLRHDEGTHLKRSDWWRQKVLVPVFVSFFSLDLCCLSVHGVRASVHSNPYPVPGVSQSVHQSSKFFSTPNIQHNQIRPQLIKPLSRRHHRDIQDTGTDSTRPRHKHHSTDRRGFDRGHTLLDDRNVLLCENHLVQLVFSSHHTHILQDPHDPL